MSDVNLVRTVGYADSEALLVSDMACGNVINVNSHADGTAHVVTHAVHLNITALVQGCSAGAAHRIGVIAVKNVTVGAAIAYSYS